MDDPRSSPADVAGAYDRWAASYDWDRNATRDLDALVVRRAALGVEGSDVVELGCGTGKNTIWLAERARSVVALDFSAGMLERARARLADAGDGAVADRVRFVRHDLRDPWPEPDGSADVVVGNLVLEHVADLAPVYAEAARVLRAGGRLWLCELHPERQRRGGQAHFTDAATGATVHVPAHRHTAGEYVNGGLAAGLVLRQLGEWVEEGAPAEAPPQLLSVLFERPRGERARSVGAARPSPSQAAAASSSSRVIAWPPGCQCTATSAPAPRSIAASSSTCDAGAIGSPRPAPRKTRRPERPGRSTSRSGTIGERRTPPASVRGWRSIIAAAMFAPFEKPAAITPSRSSP